MFMPEYSKGTENRLKICRLNCLRVRLPSPVPNTRLAKNIKNYKKIGGSLLKFVVYKKYHKAQYVVTKHLASRVLFFAKYTPPIMERKYISRRSLL